MNLPKLVVNNMTRRRGRFVFTLLGITIGIGAFVTFLALGGSLKQEVMREANALGANLVVTPKGSCAYEQVSILTGEVLPSNITMEEYARVKALPGMTVVPVLAEKSAINNRPVSVSGILPDEMRAFKGWQIAAGSDLAATDEIAVLLGAEAAEQFRLQPGGKVVVRGEALPVKGVLAATGGKDDVTVFLPLATAQRLFGTGSHVSYLAVKVDDVTGIDLAIERIREQVSLGVVSDRQMLASVLAIVGSVNVTLQLIAAVAVLAAAFGIVNTMLTATYERKREIGILQALGATRRTIFTLFLVESGLYGLLGGVCGVGSGLLFTLAVAPHLEQNAFTSFVKGSGGIGLPDPLVIGGAILFSAAVAVLAGLYPAWRASRLSPVEAISYE
ncbi:MAG: ABC transporter permease [Deltaproteobacteria bacterium]|nr:MAG: ABC transporter permease [Deltaproteobacteria bacterium]